MGARVRFEPATPRLLRRKAPEQGLDGWPACVEATASIFELQRRPLPYGPLQSNRRACTRPGSAPVRCRATFVPARAPCRGGPVTKAWNCPMILSWLLRRASREGCPLASGVRATHDPAHGAVCYRAFFFDLIVPLARQRRAQATPWFECSRLSDREAYS